MAFSKLATLTESRQIRTATEGPLLPEPMNSSRTDGNRGDGEARDSSAASSSAAGKQKEKEKSRVSRTSLILWHTHQNEAAAVRKLLEEDSDLVNAHDYDKRTPLHVAALHGLVDIAKCLIEFGADVNSQDRWKNTVRRNMSTPCILVFLLDFVLCESILCDPF